jgi:hypothetical protein
MGKGKPQQVIVTKQRKKTGTTGGCINVVLIVCTGGLWLIVPFLQWLSHLLGPRQKSKTVVYGMPNQPQQPQWQQPYYPPPQGYYPPPQDQGQWQQPQPYGYPPQQQPPMQPWPQQPPTPPQQQWPTPPQPEWGPPQGWQPPPQD